MRSDPAPAHPPTVAVFCSSKVAEGSQGYQQAYDMGFLLATAGFAVINGGGTGAMEASAKGVQAGGGRTIGALVRGVEWSLPNPYIQETIQCDDLFLRIREIYLRSDAFIFLKGGTGTLAELGIVWNLLSLEDEPAKPLFLVGEGWQDVLNALNRNLLITEKEKAVVLVCQEPAQVIGTIKEHCA
jgi:hypothetical protein